MFNSFAPRGKLSNDNESRMSYINIAYFIGILFVLFGHSHPLDDSWYHSWYWYVNSFVYTFHMPLYFFIGGYLIVHSKSVERIGYSKWVSEKLKKFLVPYFVLTIIAYIPKALLGDTNDVVELSFEYFFQTTFIVPRVGVWGHFWFIPVFVTLDLFWGAWRAKAKNNRGIYRQGLVIGLLLSLAIAAFPIMSDIYTLCDLSQNAIFYVMGVLLALCKPVFWNNWWKNIINIIIGAIGAYFLYPYAHYGVFNIPILNFIEGLLLVWCFWNLAVLLSHFIPGKFFEKISKYFFNIFIYSWPVQATLDAIMRRIGVEFNLFIAIMFISGFFVPIFIVEIYKKLNFLHCKFMDLLIGVKTI